MIMKIISPIWESINASFASFFEILNSFKNEFMSLPSESYSNNMIAFTEKESSEDQYDYEIKARRFMSAVFTSSLALWLISMGMAFTFIEPTFNAMLPGLGSIVVGVVGALFLKSLIDIVETYTIELPDTIEGKNIGNAIIVTEGISDIIRGMAPLFFNSILATMTPNQKTFAPKTGVFVNTVFSIILSSFSMMIKTIFNNNFVSALFLMSSVILFISSTSSLTQSLISTPVNPAFMAVNFILWGTSLFYIIISFKKLIG